MHLEARDPHEETGASELLLPVVVAQDVADVLAEETLDALAELLDPVEVALLHLPDDAGLRRERRDLAVDLVVPGDIRHEILDDRKRLERRDRDGLVPRQRIHAGLAGQPRAAVDFGRAGAAPTRLAVPADRQVRRMAGLD